MFLTVASSVAPFSPLAITPNGIRLTGDGMLTNRLDTSVDTAPDSLIVMKSRNACLAFSLMTKNSSGPALPTALR